MKDGYTHLPVLYFSLMHMKAIFFEQGAYCICLKFRPNRLIMDDTYRLHGIIRLHEDSSNQQFSLDGQSRN